MKFAILALLSLSFLFTGCGTFVGQGSHKVQRAPTGIEGQYNNTAEWYVDRRVRY